MRGASNNKKTVITKNKQTLAQVPSTTTMDTPHNDEDNARINERQQFESSESLSSSKPLILEDSSIVTDSNSVPSFMKTTETFMGKTRTKVIMFISVSFEKEICFQRKKYFIAI